MADGLRNGGLIQWLALKTARIKATIMSKGGTLNGVHFCHMEIGEDAETYEDLSVPELSVGDVVRLVGFEKAQLNKAQFNQHVGTIVTPLGVNGRLGVSLHRTIWPEASDANDEHPAIELRPENLRRISDRSSPKAVSVRGTVSPGMVFNLLGERGWGMPDNVVQHITDQLQVERVCQDDIIVSGCSSSRGDFPLDAILNEDRSEWWISASGSMPDGYGSEYLEFSFGAVPRRVEFVSLCIPPLPMGPLSVRHFHILALDHSGSWFVASPSLQTLDRGDLQEFALVPPIDTTSIRVVCTGNAAAATMDLSLCRNRECRNSFADCTGLFQVSFA